MPYLRVSAHSDPLSPEATRLWTAAEDWLVADGWAVELSSSGGGHWADPWDLTADPTGGTRCLDGLPDLMDALPAQPDPRRNHRAWWTMSDNSMVLNALADRGLCRLFHGHPLTLAGKAAPEQIRRFRVWSAALLDGAPFPAEMVPPVTPLQGDWPHRAAVVGGNLGALERLSATPWRPRPRGRVLLVESLSATAVEAGHRVAELVSDPWWEAIGGLLLGRFTAADKTDPTWIDGCLSLLPPEIPVARWPGVGHGADAWTIPLTEELVFSRS